jgi:hypothetical protein
MRWSALLVIGLAATLAAAAPSAGGGRQAGDELTPAMPWPPPGVASSPLAAARPSWSPPLDSGWRTRRSTTRVVPMPPAPQAPTEPAPPVAAPASPEAAAEAAPANASKPALDNATTRPRWYEESRPAPQHLYLEQLLYGEKAEGWQWDSGEMALAQSYATSVDPDSHQPLSFGIDSRMERTVLKNDAGDYEDAPMVGPRMRWRPTGHTQLDVSPMVGIATPYPMQEVVVVFGWKY